MAVFHPVLMMFVQDILEKNECAFDFFFFLKSLALWQGQTHDLFISVGKSCGDEGQNF